MLCPRLSERLPKIKLSEFLYSEWGVLSPHSLYKKSQRLISEGPDLGVDSILSPWRAVVMLFPK
jgi:hypothetical protein